MDTDKLKKDSVLYFLGKAFSSLINFAAIGIFIRLVGTGEYGKYALVLSVVLLVGNICAGWVSQGALRFHSGCDTDASKRTFEGALLKSGLYSACASAIIMTVLIFAFFEQSLWLFLLCILSLFFFVFYNIAYTKIRAELNPQKLLVIEIMMTTMRLIVPVVLIMTFSINDYKVLLTGLFFSFLVCWLLMDHHHLFVDRKAGADQIPAVIKKIWNYGWPLTLWFGISSLLNVSDRYMIKLFMDYEAVGVYSAVYDIIYMIFPLLLSPVVMAGHPMIVKCWNQGKWPETVSLLKRSIKYQVMFFLPIIGGLHLGAPFITEIILGYKDPVVAAIVVPVAGGAFLWQIGMLIHKPLELHMQTKKMVVCVSIALIGNVIGNLIFIPVYGYIAAAYTTILGSFIYCFLIAKQFKEFIEQGRL